MARRIVEEVKQPLAEPEVNQEVKVNEFQVKHDTDNQTVSFELTDGTPVEMKSPKAKQFLLLESFVKQSPQDYLTDSFTLLKLASLCISKYGKQSSISFEELIDVLELEDIERMVAALSFFRDKLEYLTRKAATI